MHASVSKITADIGQRAKAIGFEVPEKCVPLYYVTTYAPLSPANGTLTMTDPVLPTALPFPTFGAHVYRIFAGASAT